MDVQEKSKKKIQINIDKDLAEQAETVFNDIGLNQTSALTAFYKKVVAEGGLPFDLHQTPEQKANLGLRESIKKLPVEQLKTQSQVEAWFKDDTQDY
ncbi:type II toxin-antitoxin system RelB/DinJ family antitoxin [Levilactobacillus cerevisiae]|uniref:type II toxin-antitoxin system RelB/DinJ family antitoxin n=1 Tax=Levilactobacillus cerevisiae TaxID=1704076 RepID=UPI000F79E21D|nr:type II toxin-antitoxin system RelB/DinJ family antitoxin [Levilactobacillus cerevisiae]